ncbi:MAG: GNAT family N-acetyltransferase [Sphaerochaetaceae bacterium]|nr:GNAT family N-acetyltransferase [Sphaerochaetaceae bacterium]
MQTVPDCELRLATIDDIPTILTFIRELADYEHMLNQVVATEESLRYWLFDQRKAEVLLATWRDEPVGFALFFHNFSTFLGKAGIYLEDLYVRRHVRGTGCGKALLRKLAQIAVERGCGRLEWNCLDWNQPSIEFYLSLDAHPMDDWTLYRLTGDALNNLANS